MCPMKKLPDKRVFNDDRLAFASKAANELELTFRPGWSLMRMGDTCAFFYPCQTLNRHTREPDAEQLDAPGKEGNLNARTVLPYLF